MFETIHYEVATIDGDYANLRNLENPDDELKVVARAILPPEIFEGCKVKYEMLSYSME